MIAVPVMRPRLPVVDDVAPYLRQMDARRQYSNFGPLVYELERRYAERFHVDPDRVVACANATLGLQGAVAVTGARTVHCPAWTFAATPLAIAGAGATVTFHDVAEDDWQVAAPAPNGADALMPVLPFGAEIPRDRWSGWDEVVIDAAASGGARDRDLSWLPAGWSVVLSLHATKVLGSGEGGIVVFGDAQRALRFREYTVLGFADRRESDVRGTNAKLSEAGAAYALAALDGWEREESDWSCSRRLALDAEALLGVGSVCSRYPGVSPYWVVDLGSVSRLEECRTALDAAGVETRRWWPLPCTRMGAFADAGPHLPTPVSDRLAGSVLGLPFSRDLSESDVARVVDALLPVVRGSR